MFRFYVSINLKLLAVNLRLLSILLFVGYLIFK